MNPVKLILFLLAGGLFGSGLAISGMTDPARVIGFLDMFGNWDPALLFVMGGAVGVYAIGMLDPAPRRKPITPLGRVSANRPASVTRRRDLRNRLGPGRVLSRACFG